MSETVLVMIPEIVAVCTNPLIGHSKVIHLCSMAEKGGRQAWIVEVGSGYQHLEQTGTI